MKATLLQYVDGSLKRMSGLEGFDEAQLRKLATAWKDSYQSFTQPEERWFLNLEDGSWQYIVNDTWSDADVVSQIFPPLGIYPMKVDPPEDKSSQFRELFCSIRENIQGILNVVEDANSARSQELEVLRQSIDELTNSQPDDIADKIECVSRKLHRLEYLMS